MIAAVRAWGAAGCLLLSATAAAATLAEDDPLRSKLSDVDTRLTRVERIASQSLLDLSNQLEAMRSDLRAMHNDVDELGHNLEAARKQQRDLYADLDARVKLLEARGVATPGAAAAVAGPTVVSGAASAGAAAGNLAAEGGDGPDKAEYQAAFALLKAGQYDRAIVAFEKFNAEFPNSALADNGHYWLGEAFYVNRSFAEAQSAFHSVVEKYPQSRKLADALLKMGYCYYELKQWQAAHDALAQVVTKFPDAPAAKLAQQRLDKMAAEKH